MRQQRLLMVYGVLLAIIFGGVVLHTPVTIWLGTVFPSIELELKAWKEVVLVIATLLGLVLVHQRKLWRELASDWLMQIIGLYALLHVVLLGWQFQGWVPAIAGLMIDLRYVLFFVLVYVLLRLAPTWRRPLLLIGGVGAALITGFAVLQLFLPLNTLTHIGYGDDTIAPYITVDQNYDYVRYSSTLRGPNPLGAYAVVVLAVVTAVVVRRRFDVRIPKIAVPIALLLLCSSVALWVSYSRSAKAAAVVAVGLVVLATLARYFSRRTWIISCIVVGALLGGLFLARETPFISNVLLHQNPEGGSSVSSNDEHWRSLHEGTDLMLSQPFGAGIGSTGSPSIRGDNQSLIIENQYLYIAHEVGWPGVVWFLLIFGTILMRLWRVRSDYLALGVWASGIGLALIGILLPVWADDTVSIIWWGLAGLALGYHAYDQKLTNQKAKRTPQLHR